MYLLEEINFLYDTFTKLGYSNYFIDKVHEDVRRKHFARDSNTLPDARPERPPNHLVLPLNEYTQSYIKPVLKSRDCAVLFKASNTIKSKLVSNKPKKISDNDTPGVYKIPCESCPLMYIGETGRSLKIRLREHNYHVAKGNEDKSGVAKHVGQTLHPAAWADAEMLFKASDWYERCIVENVVISETSNYNKKDGLKVIDRATRKHILDALPKLKKKICPNG